jgi:hypothetical protein
MDRIRAANAGKRAAFVTIRHVDAWDEGRHTEAFLRPLVVGTRRRLAAKTCVKDSPGTDTDK